MVSVGKEETMDVNMEDMADFDIAMVLEVNADDLMADVAEVQTVLQCNNIGHVIDANEIYEKLEELTYISREERIAYVATQLIYKSGVIVEPSVAPEEHAFRFSIQSNDSNLAENISWSQEKVPVSELSGSGGTRNQNDVSYSNVIATTYGERVNVHPHEVCQNFINVPESVTVSQAHVGNQNQPNAKAIDLDIHNDCCQEFDADVETMMEEAKLIYEILPHHDFEQIYAHVRANKDSDTRLDDVTETFLQIDAASGIAQLPCTEVALTSGMNTTLVDAVQTSPMPMCALSVFPFSAPSNIDNVFHSTTSSDEKLHSNKYSVTANAVFPQETFDADLTRGDFLKSEVTDKQVCQERTESTQTHIFHVSSFIENANEIVTEKCEKGVQDNESKVVKITAEVTELPVEQKVSDEDAEQKPCEESVEGIPLSVEQKACEESVDVSPLSVEQKVSAEVIPLCAGQKLSEESAEDTPLVAQETAQQSKEATPLSVEQKVSGESMQVMSMEDITELSVSKNGDYVIDLSVSETVEDDTLSYTSNSEVHESHPSSNVFETLNSHAHSEISASSFNSPDSINADFSIEQEKDVEFSGLDEGISGSTACYQMTLQESGSDTTEILENRAQSYEHTSVTSVEDERGITEGAETEKQRSSSHDSTYSDDFINLKDSSSGEDHKDDRNVAKLQELFPGASLDYLIRISLQFDSLTDMANKVLEESPENEQNDDVSDTLSGAKLPESASLPKPPSQGCRKKEVTYKEFESSLPHVDPLLLMEIWDRIGTDYNAVKEFIAQHTQKTSNDNQYHMLLSLFPQTDPAFLREKCNVIGSNEVALKNFIDEQLQNKTEAQYHTLRAIFPQVDLAYLHEKCIEIGDDETAMRAFIVEQLKNNEGDDTYHTLLAMFPDANPAFLRETVERIGDDEDAMKVFVAEQLEEVNGVQFQTLLAVLPDADPDYLRAIYKDIGNDEESIKVFLLEALENKDYPTREAFLKRQEMATLQRKYKEEFSIEDFIEMFPDPRKHFYEKNNSSNEVIQNHGIAYLETRYRKIAMEDIRTTFKKNNHNLTLTCRELDGWKRPVQLSREIFNCTVPNTEDIPVSFLQEVAFIANEERINDFIVMKEQRKKDAFELAKANGELLECLCCFDSEVMAEDMATCTDGHLFCKECIKRSAEVAIGNAQSGFSCLTSCIAEFSLRVLRTVLKPTVFSRMVQRRQLEEVEAAGIQDLESCPFCDFATIPPPDSKVFTCYNSECMRDSCRKCKRPNHIPLHCDEVESREVKMRTSIEDRMTDALVRTCWKCKKKFIKEIGCNKMTCPCGAAMCYICRQPVTDYTHFNGQGGTEFHKCPLYSDIQVIHDVAVQEEGIKAKKEVQAQNPDIELRHDPTNPLGIPQ